MAGLIPAGRIASVQEDILPSTGTHLDIRVTPEFGPQKGKRINPVFARSILQNVVIGDKQVPVVQQQGKDWKWNFPITSPYGQRTAPTAGASTFHEGIDIGVGPETVAYRGTGSYTPGRGLGTISTVDPQGNPYKIELLHTKPGKEAGIPSPAAIPTTQPGATETGDARTNDILKAFLYGAEYGSKGETQKTLKDQLKKQLLSSALSQALNPAGFLTSYTGQDPYMSGFNAGTADWFSGALG